MIRRNKNRSATHKATNIRQEEKIATGHKYSGSDFFRENNSTFSLTV